jgi:Carboxypeptidase regulatory-like domain
MLKGCATAVVVTALSSAFAQAPARDAPPPTGTSVIRGRVIAAAGDRPVAKAEVRARAAALRVDKPALTDANGRYEITELPAGRYTVSVTKPNYVRASYGQQRPLGAGTPIDVAAGQVVAQINFSLQRTAAIAGRIVDELGDAATGVQVSALRQMFVNGERRLQNAGPSIMTNDLGEYRLFGLMPGQYFVSATLRSNMYGADGNEQTAYAPTFYPGTGNPAEAQRVAVAAGQTISGINLALLPVAPSRISGIVLDSRGQPMGGAYVNVLHRLGTSPMGGAGGAQARPDGTFTIGGLPPGEYTLRASLMGGQDEFAAADVTIAGGDVSDLQLVVAKPSIIRGRVVFENGSGRAKPPAASAVRVSILHPTVSPMSAFAGTATPKDDGTFEARTGAGQSLVRVGVFGTGDWRLARVLTADGADVIDAGLDVPTNGAVEGIVIQMTSAHNELTGTVVDAAGGKVRDCVIVVFARDPQRWTAGTRFFGLSRPDVERVFHMRLPAGDYLAAAFDDSDTAGQYDAPEILQQLREHAIAFTIGETEKKAIELPLGAPPVY